LFPSADCFSRTQYNVSVVMHVLAFKFIVELFRLVLNFGLLYGVYLNVWLNVLFENKFMEKDLKMK